MKSYLAKLTSDLIRFKTFDSPKNNSEFKKITGYIEKKLKKYKKIYIEKFNINKKPALIITFKKNHKTPKIFLNGHLDVVLADKKEFNPKIIGNKLYGRGACDMKGGCAVMIALIEYFAKQKYKPDVGFMFITDEELSGEQSHTFFKKFYKPKLLIALEPTNLDIVLETKGVIWMEGEIQGKSTHGSTPWLGDNPIEKFHNSLKNFYEKFSSLKKEQWKTTCSVNQVKSGDIFNQIPEKLTFKIDIRYLPEENPENIIYNVKKYFPSSTKWTISKCEPPQIKAENMILIKKLKTIANKQGIKTNYIKTNFASDTRFFSAGGINCAIFGAKGANFHAKNEWIDIDSLEKVFNVLKIFL